MKWYHFTSMRALKRIVGGQAVMSQYEILKQIVRDESNESELLKRIEDSMKRKEQENIREFKRRAYVWFAPDTHQCYGSFNDVVLGFELGLPPSDGKCLLVQKVSLEHLVDLGVFPDWSLKGVREIVHTAHNGKYQHVNVYRFKSS